MEAKNEKVSEGSETRKSSRRVKKVQDKQVEWTRWDFLSNPVSVERITWGKVQFLG